MRASLCGEYLQSDIAELAALSQGVHFGHGGIQETLVLEDQITVWNHLGKFWWYVCRRRIGTIQRCSGNKTTHHVSVPPSVQYAPGCVQYIVIAGFIN